MHLPRDARFDEEAERFGLRFTCEECACFSAKVELCRHGWPNQLHRLARYRQPLHEGDEIVFCKEFEIL